MRTRVTVNSVLCNNQIRLNIAYRTLTARSNNSSDYIKEVCSDLIGKFIENVYIIAKNCKGEYLKLAWAPWHGVPDTKPLTYTKTNSVCKIAKNLAWKDGKE
eukprot:3123925-Ditylum_brightwellii.AAC.1